MQDHAELGRSMLAFLRHMANEENADKQGYVWIDIEELEEIGKIAEAQFNRFDELHQVTNNRISKIAEAQFDRFDKLYQVTNNRITNLDSVLNETNIKIAYLNPDSVMILLRKHNIRLSKLDSELQQMRVKLGELEARIERQED